MLEIKYEIKLNDNGRPCIDLPPDYEQKPEDKFFAIEIARYVLQGVYGRRSAEFDSEAAKAIDITIRLLGQVGDEMAVILWKGMGDVALLLDSKYHLTVKDIEERNDICNGEYIANNGKIFKCEIGLKVFVIETLKVYELRDGIEINNWVEL